MWRQVSRFTEDVVPGVRTKALSCRQRGNLTGWNGTPSVSGRGDESKATSGRWQPCSSAVAMPGAAGLPYACQFIDPIGRAWRTMSKVKARLIGNEDLDECGLICGLCPDVRRGLGTIVVAA
jgi:hypothetical protein